MKPQKIEFPPATQDKSGPSSLVYSVSLVADCLKQTGARSGCGESFAHSEIARIALRAAHEAEQSIAALQSRISCLEKAATTDELTEVLNRRGFVGQLQKSLASAERYEEQGVLLYVDLDGFKPVNDMYGHAAGDEVLRQVARVLRGNIRDCDCVGRLGGDEFAVLLTRSSWKDGLMRAEALEQALNNTYVGWNGRMIALRASFGIQAYGPRDDEHELLARADDAMYKTKRMRAELAANRSPDRRPQETEAWETRTAA